MALCYHCGADMGTDVDHWEAGMPFCYLCAYKRGYVE